MAGTTKKMTKKIPMNEKLYLDIKEYCQINGVDDVDKFINKCTLQGFNIVRFGFTPKDNVNREKLGIREPDDNTNDAVKEQAKEEKKVTKRPIRIVKKD